MKAPTTPQEQAERIAWLRPVATGCIATQACRIAANGEQFLARINPALRAIADAVEGVNRFRDTPAGLLRLNLNESAALEDFLLASLRIWTKR